MMHLNSKKYFFLSIFDLRGLSVNESFADLILLINLQILFGRMSNFQIFILEAFNKRILIFSLIRRLLKILIFHRIMIVSHFFTNKNVEGANFKNPRPTVF